MNFITKRLEKKLGVDLNGDGVIGSGRLAPGIRPPNYQHYGGPSYPPPPSNFQQSGNGGAGLINELEKATNIDLNHDGRIGGQPGYPPNYPPPRSNFQQPGSNNGMINELEKATNIDLNGDGRIGGQPGYPPNYPPNFNQYGGPPNYPPNSGGGGASMINELEKATNIDINRDGRIGGQPGYPPNYPPNFNQYGGPPNYPPNGGGAGGASMINELEKATNIDINRDGRIGGQPGYPPNYPPYGGPSNYPSYSGPPSYPPYGGPSYPPPPSSNFNQPGNGLINELEKATNIDLNHDGRIGGPPGYPPNHQQFSGPSYPPPFNPYSGPPPPSNFNQPGGNNSLINELEKATNIDLNGDGRIGGQPGYPPNYNQYGYGR